MLKDIVQENVINIIVRLLNFSDVTAGLELFFSLIDFFSIDIFKMFLHQIRSLCP